MPLERSSPKRTMRSIIKFLIFLLLPVVGWSADSTYQAVDSTQVEIRQFNQSAIEEHKADSDFDYGLRPEEELSLWQRLKIWLNQILQKLFYYGTETPVGKIIVYVLIAIAFVYAIYRLSTIKSSQLFYGNKGEDLGYDLYHENIHEMNFEQLIEEAVSNKNYRLAIRLIYLFSLKKLADKQVINWQPGKTNFDYVNEVTEPQLKQGFHDLSYYFDYSWYGDFEVNKSLFVKVEQIFNRWKNNLKA